MGFKGTKKEKKELYDVKLCKYLNDYHSALVCSADNVGSSQMQRIRQGLRPESALLMGKNTLMKRTIRNYAEKSGNKDVLNLIPLLVGNVGFVFTNEDLKDVREAIAKYRVGAPARVGLVAPVDVTIPAQTTGLDPSHTSFFQLLSISTKINKGSVEIISPVELIKKGTKVGSSEAALLSKLGIKPFSYGLVVCKVYDRGSVFDPEVLDLTDDDLVAKLAVAVSSVTALSLALGYPTLAAASHLFQASYKNVLAVALGTGYSYPQAEMAKEYLKDPSKFVVAAAPVAAESRAPAAPAAEETKEEVDEEEDDGNITNLFGDD